LALPICLDAKLTDPGLSLASLDQIGNGLRRKSRIDDQHVGRW
jgi:hypothetical protein